MTLDPTFLHALEAVAPVRRNEPLSRHTTIGIGGPADAYIAAETTEQLAAAVHLCTRTETPFFVLGSGSNIVVGDRGIRGLTIENNATAVTWIGDEEEAPGRQPTTASAPVKRTLRAAAGASFAATARQLAFAGYAGLEWACGIPGTIGGAVVYNAGAYGGCLGDVLLRVALNGAGGEVVLPAEDLGLVYRGSAFTRGLMAGRAVFWAEFALWPGDATELRARVAAYDAKRLDAQPRGRNAGSFFKNPPGRPAWRLIDGVGMRGYRIGGAEFSAKHCNFLINAGNATAADVAALKSLAQQRIRDRYGIDLENEVSLVGEGFGDA